MEITEKWKREIGNKTNGYSHHAYFLAGDPEKNLSLLENFLKTEFEIAQQGNPDFHIYDVPVLLLENAKAIRWEESRRAMTVDAKKVFVVLFRQIHYVSADALLKMIEEPHRDSLFFFLAPSREVLSLTLQSRFSFLSSGGDSREISLEEKKRYRQFLSAAGKVRFEILSEIIKEKDRPRAIDFLNHLEYFLYQENTLQNAEKEILSAFREIEKGKDYLKDPSSSVKLILEHLSLVIPQKEYA